MQNDDSQETADQSLLALSVALAHPVISADPSLLCAVARACTAWRDAVQQCSACNAVISIEAQASLPWLCSFTRWLPKHAPLVKQINSSGWGTLRRQGKLQGLTWQAHLEAAQHIVQQALQLAAAAPAHATPAVSAAAGVSAAPHPQQQERQGLRLSSFSMDWLVTPGMLAALPVHSLTSLQLNLELTTSNPNWDYKATGGMATAAAMSRLSSLRDLSLGITHDILSSDMSVACLASIAQLRQLTSLHLYGTWADVEQPLQQLLSQPPPLLRRLQLGVEVESHFRMPAVDMSAATQLEYFSTGQLLPPGVVFPVLLRELELAACDDSSRLLAAVMPLQQLTSLGLRVRFQDWQALVQLCQLPALQELALWYQDEGVFSTAAAATAAAWPQLPQLQRLAINFDVPPGRQQLAAILAGVAGATMLESLSLNDLAVCEDDDAAAIAAAVDEDVDFDIDGLPAAVCGSLAGLTRLQSLDLHFCKLLPDDALALTALTNLTELHLHHMGAAVTDVAATALACSLRQLHSLGLSGCSLGDMVCLAAVGQLRQLTALQLRGCGEVNERGLRLLTGLSRLQQLEVGS